MIRKLELELRHDGVAPAIADSDGRDHSLSYGIVCGITLIFGYRAWIKRTPRSIAVLALFTHLLGFIVVLYNFFGTQSSDSQELWDTLVSPKRTGSSNQAALKLAPVVSLEIADATR